MSALTSETQYAGLPVDCLVLVDFAYLFLVVFLKLNQFGKNLL